MELILFTHVQYYFLFEYFYINLLVSASYIIILFIEYSLEHTLAYVDFIFYNKEICYIQCIVIENLNSGV